MQLCTKNVVITSVMSDPANFRIFPICVRLNFTISLNYKLIICKPYARLCRFYKGVSRLKEL